MTEQKEGLAPAKGQAVESKSTPRNHTATTARLRRLRYQPPGENETIALHLGPRQWELLHALAAGPSTRAELVKRGPPRLGLSAPQNVEKLRAKGLSIETAWLRGVDAEGNTIRFGRYSLRGRLLELEGVPRG